MKRKPFEYQVGIQVRFQNNSNPYGAGQTHTVVSRSSFMVDTTQTPMLCLRGREDRKLRFAIPAEVRPANRKERE